MTKKINDCSLLPHTKENIFGFNRNSAQIYGWEIKKFDIPSEWKYSQGENVRVAVIDTGCDLYHNDLKDNILQGKNFISPNKDPIDDNGHGTHVSGTIAAKNNGIGIVGVAPMSKIIPIKALDADGNGSNKDIAKAIVWAVDNSSDLITMSLGSSNDSLEIRSAINYATKKNVTIFCAAGNFGELVDIMYPAKYVDTISIGSIDQNLKRSNFSCAGDTLDFLSPGENIIGCTPNNNYAIMSGTSMANPFAVGCACLLLSYSKKHNIKIQNKNDYINIFKQNTVSLKQNKFQEKKYQGYGIIQPSCKHINYGSRT
jgi:subtilisin family serine protease